MLPNDDDDASEASGIKVNSIQRFNIFHMQRQQSYQTEIIVVFITCIWSCTKNTSLYVELFFKCTHFFKFYATTSCEYFTKINTRKENE